MCQHSAKQKVSAFQCTLNISYHIIQDDDYGGENQTMAEYWGISYYIPHVIYTYYWSWRRWHEDWIMLSAWLQLLQKSKINNMRTWKLCSVVAPYLTCLCRTVIKAPRRHVQYNVTCSGAGVQTSDQRGHLLTKELFLPVIIPMHMMNGEIIPGRKRGFDDVLYKLWPLLMP